MSVLLNAQMEGRVRMLLIILVMNGCGSQTASTISSSTYDIPDEPISADDNTWITGTGSDQAVHCLDESQTAGHPAAEGICICKGDSIEAIPDNLNLNMRRLMMMETNIQNITRDSLSSYRRTLRDIVIFIAPKLVFIEPGCFSNLNQLRTIEISHAPILQHISDLVFHINLPKLKVLKIIHSGLEAIPNLNFLQTDGILDEIDLDGNNIRRIYSSSVKVKVAHLLLQHNQIEEVEDRAFFGSEINKLSLRGNKRLTELHEDAFVELKSLRELDLSETGIRRLPTGGLDELELLSVQNTHSLKVFPSIYHFKSISTALLTYPYHCCAFHFPAAHDPTEFAKHQKFVEEMENRLCSRQAVEETLHGGPTVRQQPVEILQEVAHTRVLRYRYISRANFEEQRLTMSSRLAQTINSGFGDILPITKSFNNRSNVTSYSWGTLPLGDSPAQQSTVYPRPEILHVVPASGFGQLPSAREFMDPDGGGEHDDLDGGTFLQSKVAMSPNVSRSVFCGKLSKNYREVQCYPIPDAFNPCEDVMGNMGLRVTVWFVVVFAVFGNLAVMGVLMSSRFKMSVSKFLMCNLAFADFCMGLYLLIVASMDLHTMGEYFNYAIDWQEGPGCRVAGFLTVFASELSIFTLTVITLERWYAITYAIHLTKRLRLGAASRIMLCGWVYALTLAALPLFGVSSFSRTSICLPMDNFDLTGLSYLVVLLTINGLSFLLICACYAKMYISISSQNSTVIQNDMTVAKRMAMLVFTDFACWAPIAFFGLTAVAGYPLINVTNSKILLVFFYPLNSCANPFLYAILTKQYRRDLFVMLSRYGFCTQRANKYKPSYTSNTHTKVSIGPSNRNSSMPIDLNHHNRRNSADDPAANSNSPSKAKKSNDLCPENAKSNGAADGERRLSIVLENAGHVSEEESPVPCSPVHKGSPHPIKSNYTRLGAAMGQEQCLQRVLAYDKVIALEKSGAFDRDEIIPLTNNVDGSNTIDSSRQEDSAV